MHFLGVISPPILLLAVPALVGRWSLRRWRAVMGAVGAAGLSSVVLRAIALAWFLGTFAPFGLLSLLWSRTSYLYYMVIVMPGLYVAGACVLGAAGPPAPSGARGLGCEPCSRRPWCMYPFTPLP